MAVKYRTLADRRMFPEWQYLYVSCYLRWGTLSLTPRGILLGHRQVAMLDSENILYPSIGWNISPTRNRGTSMLGDQNQYGYTNLLVAP